MFTPSNYVQGIGPGLSAKRRSGRLRISPPPPQELCASALGEGAEGRPDRQGARGERQEGGGRRRKDLRGKSRGCPLAARRSGLIAVDVKVDVTWNDLRVRDPIFGNSIFANIFFPLFALLEPQII